MITILLWTGAVLCLVFAYSLDVAASKSVPENEYVANHPYGKGY